LPKVLLTTVCVLLGETAKGILWVAELFQRTGDAKPGYLQLSPGDRCWGLTTSQRTSMLRRWSSTIPRSANFSVKLRSAVLITSGINFVVAPSTRSEGWYDLIRNCSPRSKIVLGGYGTVLPDDVLAPFGDFICREEGISFMRRLLGEHPDRPIRHPYAPIESPRVFSYPLNTKVATSPRSRVPQWMRLLLHLPLFQPQIRPFSAERQGTVRYDSAHRAKGNGCR